MRMVKAVTILAMLTGCATTDEPVVPGGGPDVLRNEINARTDATRAMTDRLTAQGDTFFMPSGGIARYNGYGVVSAEASPTNVTAIGTATIDADFSSGTLSGRVNNFVGRDSTGGDKIFSGGVTLSNGIIGNRSANSLDVVYNGALDSNNDHIVMDGIASGGFAGSGASGLAALSQDDPMLVNGNPTLGTFILVGER